MTQITHDRAVGLPRGGALRRAAIATYIGLHIAGYILLQPFNFIQVDWELWRALPEAIATGSLYVPDPPMPFVWSPLLAPPMALVGITGFWPQAVLQVAVVLLLRDRILITLILASPLFWPAVMGGNPLFTVSLVLAVLAFRGERWAVLGFLMLAMMIPRPLFMPLAGWLLWKRPDVRVPFAAIFLIHGVAVLAAGYAIPWIEAAVTYSRTPRLDLGLTAWIGMRWLVVGVPLAIWLTWRGHPGWAGLAASPYTLQGYLLMPFVEFRRRSSEPPPEPMSEP